MSCNDGYVKITRPKAKRLFDEGKTLYLLPCKCSRVCLVEVCGIRPATITKNNDAGRTFEKLVNSFEYYNCNRELGYYTHFYVREDNKENGGSSDEVVTKG